jgi:hypothetical protein
MALYRATIERLQRGEPFESERLHADGSRLTVLIHPAALQDMRGTPYALAITERPASKFDTWERRKNRTRMGRAKRNPSFPLRSTHPMDVFTTKHRATVFGRVLGLCG